MAAAVGRSVLLLQFGGFVTEGPMVTTVETAYGAGMLSTAGVTAEGVVAAHRPARARTAVRATASRVAVGGPVVVAVASVVASFGPWVRSGARSRTLVESARAAHELDIVQGGWVPLLRVASAFLPFASALAVLAATLGRRCAAATIAAVVGAVVALAAGAVLVSPLHTGWAPGLALAAGTAGIIVAVAALATSGEGKRS